MAKEFELLARDGALHPTLKAIQTPNPAFVFPAAYYW
jgi:hypothetical protein